MGMGTHKGKGLLAEINVTPLVDVMLVLLIIFMVTAPMMTKGLDVQLPRTTAKALPQEQKPVTITVNTAGKIFLDGIQVTEDVLKERLPRVEGPDNSGTRQVLLRADKAVPYGTVAQIIATVREAGIEDLGLVTEPVNP